MRRPFYGWLTAGFVSLIGTRISLIAIPLFVLEQTGSASRTGVVALAETLPLVVFKVLGGPLIDRVGPRQITISCDAASFVVVGAIAVLYDSGLLSFTGFVALVAVAGALRGPGDGAKDAMVPALVAEAGVPLERATGLESTAERTASMLGAAIAGLLVAGIGAANALLVDAATFGASALVMAWATVGMSHPEPVDDADPAPYREQLREGWDFLRRDRLLLGITVMVALTNMLDAAWSSVLLPVWSVETGYGARVLGLLFAVFAAGSAIGSIVAALWAARLPRYWIYLGAFLITGLPRFLMLAFDAPALAIVMVFVVAGFASGFLNPILGAIIFERIPTPLVGRVSSMTTAMCFALMPLGGLAAGLLIDSWSLTGVLILAGVAYFAVTMLPAVDPTWREMDRRPDSSPTADPSLI